MLSMQLLAQQSTLLRQFEPAPPLQVPVLAPTVQQTMVPMLSLAQHWPIALVKEISQSVWRA